MVTFLFLLTFLVICPLMGITCHFSCPFFPYSLLAQLMRKKPIDFVFRGFAGRSHHA